MKIVEISFLQSKLYSKILPNGLTVSVLPRPEFHQTYGIFATDFGSMIVNLSRMVKKSGLGFQMGQHIFWNIKCLKKKQAMYFSNLPSREPQLMHILPLHVRLIYFLVPMLFGKILKH